MAKTNGQVRLESAMGLISLMDEGDAIQLLADALDGVLARRMLVVSRSAHASLDLAQVALHAAAKEIRRG